MACHTLIESACKGISGFGNTFHPLSKEGSNIFERSPEFISSLKPISGPGCASSGKADAKRLKLSIVMMMMLLMMI